MSDGTSLAERIREEREWLGFSCEQAAEKLGVELADVEAWESGGLVPTAEQVQRMAALFGLSVERLYGAPLVEDLGGVLLCGGKDLTHEDRYQVARFAEFLRHRHQDELADDAAGAPR